MLNLLMTKDNSQPTDQGCVDNVTQHNRLMQTDFSYYNVRKATEQNCAIKYLKVAIVTNFAYEWRLPNGGFKDYDVSERLLQNMKVDEKFYKGRLHEPWKNYYIEHENPFVKDDEFISILIEQALEEDEGYFGLIKSGRFNGEPFKASDRGDRKTFTYIFGIAGEPGRDIPSAEWVKTQIENLYIANLKDIRFEVYTTEVSSRPYRAPKPKGNDESEHFDSKGVLIEIGDTVVFPRGGDHNFYWCDFSKVVRFTKEYMEMENGQKAMCKKCIVVKTDKNKKLSFEE